MGNGHFEISIRALRGAELADAPRSYGKSFRNTKHRSTRKADVLGCDTRKDDLEQLRACGAFGEGAPVGIIATRGGGQHLALFFGKGTYHGKGIGRALWNRGLWKRAAETITVHSSGDAVPIYEKLGFVKTAEMQTGGGFADTPMECRLFSAEIGDSKKTPGASF